MAAPGGEWGLSYRLRYTSCYYASSTSYRTTPLTRADFARGETKSRIKCARKGKTQNMLLPRNSTSSQAVWDRFKKRDVVDSFTIRALTVFHVSCVVPKTRATKLWRAVGRGPRRWRRRRGNYVTFDVIVTEHTGRCCSDFPCIPASLSTHDKLLITTIDEKYVTKIIKLT